MVSSEIYNEGYDFARKSSNRKTKLLKLVTLLFPIFILFVLFVGFVSSLDMFKKTSETVTKVNTKDAQQEELNRETRLIEQAYTQAGIPYDDPNGRFSIDFVTPFVSSELVVVINTDKEYDIAKVEADKVINTMKSQVKVTSVSYKKL
jgi:hypothetical protein